MRVLITGGVGFIGSHLAEALLEKGHGVFIIDNLSSGKSGNIPEKATFWFRDVGKDQAVRDIFRLVRPDIVVHAAAAMKDPDDWTEDVNTNVIGTINVIRQSIRFEVKRLIYLQTSLCYGYPQECPITLNHPINPTLSSYPISKVAAERYIMMSGLDYVSFRLANCYGPRNLSGPFATFYRELTAGRKCTVVDTRRDFVYIDDLIRVLMMAIKGTGKGVYHVSSGEDHSIREVYDGVFNAVNIAATEYIQPENRKRGSDDVPSLLLDPTRTKKDFGIMPEVLLADGIIKAVEWYKEHGVGETYTHLRGLNGKRMK